MPFLAAAAATLRPWPAYAQELPHETWHSPESRPLAVGCTDVREIDVPFRVDTSGRP
jgi:hypothetical protein